MFLYMLKLKQNAFRVAQNLIAAFDEGTANGWTTHRWLTEFHSGNMKPDNDSRGLLETAIVDNELDGWIESPGH